MVHSWISESGTTFDDSVFDHPTQGLFSWTPDNVAENWPEALSNAIKILMTARTKDRISFMTGQLVPLARDADLDLAQTLDLFGLLTKTISRYTDSASQDAVEAIGMELVKKDELRGTSKLGVTELIIGWLVNEVGRIYKPGLSSSCAPSDLFVLLGWSCRLYTICLAYNRGFASTPSWKSLSTSLAYLLDLLLTDSTAVKSSMRKSAIARCRRALRSDPGSLPDLINSLLIQADSGQAPLALTPLIGVTVDVTLRLGKSTETPVQIDDETKARILTLYNNVVVMSKIPVPSHTSTALNDFITTCVAADDLSSTVLPVMTKALLRSPEYSLTVITQFFRAFPHPITEVIFGRILTPILNSAKSSNPLVRSNAVELFKVVVERNATDPILELAVDELLRLPQASKTAGPDHRATLYAMLSFIAPSKAVSHSLVQTLPPLLARETHDAAISHLASVIPQHIRTLFHANEPLSRETTNLLAKEMNSTKPALRRAFCSAVGSVLWQSGDLKSEASLAFATAVLPSLEASLKNTASNPLSFPPGPLAGYIALAVLIGPLSRSGKFGDIIARNPVVQSLESVSSKPSFLLWDKVYKKISDPEEEAWLIRAIEATLTHSRSELDKNSSLRSQLGLVLLHLSLHSKSSDTRRAILAAIERSAQQSPLLINAIIREALYTMLSRETANDTANVAEDTQPSPSQSGRLSAVLHHCVSFDDSLDISEREKILVELIVLSHHHLAASTSQPTWIALCQKARADPQHVVDNNIDRLFELVLTASAPVANSSTSLALAEASYQAITTLAFVSPKHILHRALDQLRIDINPAVINTITETEIAIWATPEGTAFVDVLSSRKGGLQPKKGKDYEISKWEDDVRKSLASKKPTSSVTLTKQEQALVQAQLDKESVVRQRVASIKATFGRGLRIIRSLVAAGNIDSKLFMSRVVPLLLEGAFHSVLADQTSYDTYLDLSKCCAPRLESFREWAGLATLRSLEVKAVPEEFRVEPIGALVLRVLYRLRSLSERQPFDSATFSYLFPLLGQVLTRGGVGVEGEDETLEQISLVLDVIKFHCAEFSDSAFPRAKTIGVLLHAVRQQPRVTKEASSALIQLGEAISSTSTRDEVDMLLHGLLHQETYVRNSCLQTLQPFDLTDLDWSPELWIACHDEDEQNARLAQHVWDDNGLDVPELFLPKLLGFLEHENAFVRTSSPAAIAEAVESWPQSIQPTLSTLQDFYREKAKILAPEFDEYGMVVANSLDRADPWPTRSAIAVTFEKLSPAFSPKDLEPFFAFLITDEALGDRHADVRQAMLAAGTTIIDAHGQTQLTALITMFESYLASPSPSTETGDHIKEAVVILIGRVARHLDPSDQRIPVIVDRLVDALKTPSEQVQMAVSDCMSPLIKLIRPQVGQLVDKLLDELVEAEKYAARRGAAYGLAGIVKGTGLGGIKEFGVMNRLRAATEDKKRYEARQGPMFAFETLSSTLGRHFEPYVTHILPLLLTSFGDGTSDVREATQDAAKVIMANMSAYGVKMILPSLLSGLDEKQWRTKKGSIELLGMMAYCSPRQLSLSLPIVIPRLTGVLTDSHAQVRAAANKSLKQFGEVISNPEIQSLVPVLLKALVDPARIPVALSSLLKTSFMHYIDHSSLALVIPILERGLRERSAETKKKAARIVGNLASLTDSKDFVPYLSELLPMVHVVLIDPVPEARATAAKALGTLVERLGENHFPDLVPGLIRTLKSDSSGVDRQGAAQGLSEVLSGLGMERLEGLLPDIIANAQSPRSTVREGFMSLLVYLPATFGTRFQPHLPKIIAPILGGLADTEEYVREAAMRAGRMVVTNYSSKAIDLLLPELERGMFDGGWRIRLSSITLVGELLFKVSGISGKTEIEEEEVIESGNAEASRRALTEVLGSDRRDRILSALYMVRHDGVNVVRQSSIHIWKALVQNTPRTVRELLPELVNQIVALMTGSEIEQQEIAGRTTSELCRKFGEKVLAEIVNILRGHSTSQDSKTREGVCLVISEVLDNTSDGQREGHEDVIIAMVRGSLVDDESNVRSAAAKAFDSLQSHLGAKAIDQTIPTLLEALRQPGKSSGTALQALREVMNVRASTVFPVLIPTLLSEPITVFNARALGSLVTVAGNALSKRLNVIMNSLVKVLEDGTDEELKFAVDDTLHKLIASVADPEGLNTLMMILLGWVSHVSPKRRVSGHNLFAVFCESSELDSSLYRVDWVRQLISGLDDPQVAVHTAAWNALDVFVKSIPKDELESLVIPLRRAIEGVGGPGINVPGFSLPKGVSPLVPITIAGLITGNNDQREQAAYTIGDLVERTEEGAIKPFVVPFTGPLIRVATQATTYPPGVKTAILSALKSMLERIPSFVKPFFPQLQRTFVKSASDPASAVVRTKAAQALGVLMRHQPRVDPVIVELIGGVENQTDEAIASSLVLSLADVVRNAHQNMGDKAKEGCVELAMEAFKESNDENYIRSVAILIASLSVFPNLLEPLVEANLTSGTLPSVLCSHTILALLTPDEDGVQPSRNLFQQLSVLPSVAQKVLQSAGSDKPAISRPAREARELLKALEDDSILALF